jgi:hypothetical protein
MKPQQGKICLVNRIPTCDFCQNPGPYDFKTTFGPWAHGCKQHYHAHRAYPDLGVGKAQIWITLEQVS